MSRSCVVTIGILVASISRLGAAHDKWEGPASCPDDALPVCNQLIHGQPQTHDTEGSPGQDVDLMTVETKNRRSYEVRAFSSNQIWPPDAAAGFPTHARIERVDGTGNVLTFGFCPDGLGPTGTASNWNVVRWIGTADQRDYIRVRANSMYASTADDQYDVELLETTYYVPRWNASGTQVTVLLIQNMTTQTVTGSVLFYDSAGTLVYTHGITVPRNGMSNLNTSTLGLAGSGHVQIVHLGGWSALSVKAVALEPATGFSFDTPGAQRPR